MEEIIHLTKGEYLELREYRDKWETDPKIKTDRRTLMIVLFCGIMIGVLSCIVFHIPATILGDLL